jgi:hypothetical protein
MDIDKLKKALLTTLSIGDKNEVVKCMMVVNWSESEIFANVKTNKYEEM